MRSSYESGENDVKQNSDVSCVEGLSVQNELTIDSRLVRSIFKTVSLVIILSQTDNPKDCVMVQLFDFLTQNGDSFRLIRKNRDDDSQLYCALIINGYVHYSSRLTLNVSEDKAGAGYKGNVDGKEMLETLINIEEKCKCSACNIL